MTPKYSDKRFDAYILDKDGIMVDTEPLHFEARRLALAGLGIQLTKEAYIEKCMSRGHRDQLAATCPTTVLPDSAYDALYRGGIQPLYHLLRATRLSPVPGFQEFFNKLSLHRYTLAVASTQPLASVKEAVAHALGDMARNLRAIVSGEDTKRNKPAPDVYLKAAELIGIPPDRCVAIEDSPVGVRAAKAAGMYCIARLSEWSTTRALREAGADLVVQDFAEIQL